MQAPLVSILIPAYNAAKTIAVAIESCLSQGYSHIEILILDDGSTDTTVAEIKKFNGVILLQHEKKSGTPAARNTLLKASSGEFVAWLDADDMMLPNRIERQVLFMHKNPQVDIAGSWILTDNNVLPLRKFPTGNKMITAHLWFKNCLVQPGIISRNFYVKENIFYNTAYYYMQDYELWYRLRNKKVFANIPEFLTRYHVSSLTETRQKRSAYQSVQKPSQLWEVKWADGDFGFDEAQKQLLQKFLVDDGRIYKLEIRLLKGMFNRMKANKNFSKVPENILMLDLYRLLAFTRLDFVNRLLNLDLLTSLPKYSMLKKMYLIQ